MRSIKYLLYEKGFTIDGARAQLKSEIEQLQNSPSAVNSIPDSELPKKEAGVNVMEVRDFFKDTLRDLDNILYELETEN